MKNYLVRQAWSSAFYPLLFLFVAWSVFVFEVFAGVDLTFLGVLPRQMLENLPEALNRVANANQAMSQHYRGQKALHSRSASGSPTPA